MKGGGVRMTLRKIEVFFLVATKLNMTKVSKEYFVSQPAISQMIKEIENEFEAKLFNRIGKKLYLTNEGKVLKEYSRKILNLHNNLKDDLSDFKILSKGELRIGASTTFGIYLLPSIVNRFSTLYPDVNILVTIENTEHICKLVVNDELDFAFIESDSTEIDLISKKILEDELVFISSPNHPWAKLDLLKKNDIQKGKFILREIGSGTRSVFENAMKKNKIKYKVDFTFGNTEAIKQLVINNLGVGCISSLACKNEVNDGKIKTYRISNINLKRSFNLIYHKDKYLSKLIKKFISLE